MDALKLKNVLCISLKVEKNHITWKYLAILENVWRGDCGEHIVSHLTHAKNTFTAWELRVKNADFTDKNLSLNGIRQ